MKVEELRVGILVGVEDIESVIPVTINGLVQVVNNEPYDVHVKWSDGFYSEIQIKEIKRIPLTEEWLLKFGYQKCSFRDNHMVIQGHTIWICNDLFLCEKNGMVLMYVHQLQNLYFALTSKELIVSKMADSPV
tara:strand:- start:61 stop:459 length:399 start_codon:yes stop_codon:yes gene_type:complete